MGREGNRKMSIRSEKEGLNGKGKGEVSKMPDGTGME